jgi:nucleoside-diphosphate-sugar epimerase
MSGPSVFVTGASGFVGRRLLPALARSGRSVVALDRSGRLSGADALPGGSVCRGDLLSPATYTDALRGCDLVVHLAAATGKASAADHHRVNALGTEALLAACRAAGVPRVLFVSSIAVTFGDQTGYHYAVAKAAAEQAVRRSGLRTAIVRPTMVFGEGSPVETGLAKLALLPMVVVPGTGRVRVQPIHVDDLVACLVEIIEKDLFADGVIEVGGPEVVAIEDLLLAIRAARGGGPGRVVHVPLSLLRAPVLAGEWAGLGAALPVTAGQLASFGNEGTAAPGPLTAAEPARMAPLARMLGRDGAVGSEPDALDRECQVFTRHLIGVAADAFVLAAYRDAVGRLPALQPKTAFDDLLLSWARRGGWWTRVADAYAALFARDSALRRRLVMALAILETRAPFHLLIDAPVTAPGAGLWARVFVRVVLGLVGTGVGVLVFVPARAALAVLGRGGR